MRRFLPVIALLLHVLISESAAAHELRPAFLDIRELSGNNYAITWKVPALGERRLSLHVLMPDDCKNVGEKVGAFREAAFFERWTTHCRSGLAGEAISIGGLRSSLTDVLVRIEYETGTVQTVRLTAERPKFEASGSETWFGVAVTYLKLGIEHILTGFDHLLFVLALCLLIRDPWGLAKTITAFTVAHSLTLMGSALGYFSLPQKPVEAAIALSIAFVASELIKTEPSAPRSSATYPWLIAFVFGLLHGFGFAGALKEVGLPQGDVFLALLFFNLGVEVGQLVFVAAILAVLYCLSRLVIFEPSRARVAAGYVIGVTSATWLVFRLSTFVG
jgi:hydrogenase/urease accessory protein HupE